MSKITFAFVKREWLHQNLMSQTPVKAAFTVDKVAYHPRCGASADNKFNVIAHSCPTVPKILESRYETRFGGIHPRKFIYEDDFLAFR